MNKAFLSLLIVTLFLSACAPAAIPATATSTPIPPTATMTMTPPPTATATPIAVDGVAEIDGALYVYDDQTKIWVALPSLPEGTTAAKIDDAGVVGAYDTQNQLLFTLNGMDWEKVEAPIRSCADPRVIAEQDAAFTERTGIALNNPDPADARSTQFAEIMATIAGVSYHPDKPEIVNMPFVKTGAGRVKVEGVSGISELVCLYARSGNFPGETVAIVAGYIDASGKYMPLTMAFDYYSPDAKAEPKKFKTYDGQEQLDWMMGLADGISLSINLHTLAEVKDVAELKAREDWNTDNTTRVQDFLRKWGGDMVRRIGGKNGGMTGMWEYLEPEDGDPGMMLAGSWAVDGTIQESYGFDLEGN